MEDYKICTRCGYEFRKSAEYFWRNRSKKDGLESQCKSCMAIKGRRWRLNNAEYLRRFGRQWRINNQGYQHKYYTNNKDKFAIYRQTGKKQGKSRARSAARVISPRPCEYPNCKSNKKPERHHWDYSKPLDVVFLCSKHHAIANRVKKIIDNLLY